MIRLTTALLTPGAILAAATAASAVEPQGWLHLQPRCASVQVYMPRPRSSATYARAGTASSNVAVPAAAWPASIDEGAKAQLHSLLNAVLPS